MVRLHQFHQTLPWNLQRKLALSPRWAAPACRLPWLKRYFKCNLPVNNLQLSDQFAFPVVPLPKRYGLTLWPGGETDYAPGLANMAGTIDLSRRHILRHGADAEYTSQLWSPYPPGDVFQYQPSKYDTEPLKGGRVDYRRRPLLTAARYGLERPPATE